MHGSRDHPGKRSHSRPPDEGEGPGFGDAPIDEVISQLLDEHADLVLRARMRADAEHARNNADDREEVRRVQADMDEISAW
jgi:hypothetical protein